MAETCIWTVEDADNDVWRASCGHLFIFTVGGPPEHRFVFCPYCGKRIDAPVENVDRAEDLECPCCGCEGAEPAKDGFYDGQSLTCGCPGHVCVEEDGSAWINNGDELCGQATTDDAVARYWREKGTP